MKIITTILGTLLGLIFTAAFFGAVIFFVGQFLSWM